MWELSRQPPREKPRTPPPPAGFNANVIRKTSVRRIPQAKKIEIQALCICEARIWCFSPLLHMLSHRSCIWFEGSWRHALGSRSLLWSNGILLMRCAWYEWACIDDSMRAEDDWSQLFYILAVRIDVWHKSLGSLIGRSLNIFSTKFPWLEISEMHRWAFQGWCCQTVTWVNWIKVDANVIAQSLNWVLLLWCDRSIRPSLRFPLQIIFGFE